MFRQQSCFDNDIAKISPLQNSQERLILQEMYQCMRSILRAVEEKQGNAIAHFLFTRRNWKPFPGGVFEEIGFLHSHHMKNLVASQHVSSKDKDLEREKYKGSEGETIKSAEKRRGKEKGTFQLSLMASIRFDSQPCKPNLTFSSSI